MKDAFTYDIREFAEGEFRDAEVKAEIARVSGREARARGLDQKVADLFARHRRRVG